MPILACTIPSFPAALLARADPALAARPLALLGPDERVLDATPPAWQAGIAPGQTPRQARAHCPGLELRPADLDACTREFEALLAQLDEFSDRVEPAGLGRAYLDVPELNDRNTLPFAQQLGRDVRRAFGQALQPAVGCDSGKFTARAAADTSRAGTVRVVPAADERPFLRPLSVRLLPLDEDHCLRLRYLGIRLLGQYADLPSRAVLQQFGRSGQLAQRWARGQDDRPVVPRHKRPVLGAAMNFDPPLEAAPPLLRAAARLLERPLAELRARFQGAQVLAATRTWTTGQAQEERWALAAPCADPARMLALLERWQSGAWEGGVTRLALTLSEVQDQAVWQATMFPEAEEVARREREQLLARLRVRFGAGYLWQALVQDPLALRVERRAAWQEAAA